MRARVEADGEGYDGFIEEIKQLALAQREALFHQLENHQTLIGLVEFLHSSFVISMAQMREKGEKLSYSDYLDAFIALYPLVTDSTQTEILLIIESIPDEHRRILEWLKLFPSMQPEQREIFVEKSLCIAQSFTDEYEQQEIYRALLPYLDASRKNNLIPRLIDYALSFRTGDVWEDGDSYFTGVSFLSKTILGSDGAIQQEIINILWDIVDQGRHEIFLWYDLSKIMPYLSEEQQNIVSKSLVEFIRLVCEGEKDTDSFYRFRSKFSLIFPYFNDEQRRLTLGLMIELGKSKKYWNLINWLEDIAPYIPALQREQILEILWDSEKEDFAVCIKFFNNILPYSTQIERQKILEVMRTPVNSPHLLARMPQFWTAITKDEYQIWIRKFQHYLLANNLDPKHYEFTTPDELLEYFYSQIPLFPSGIFQAHEIDQITGNLIQVCTRWRWI